MRKFLIVFTSFYSIFIPGNNIVYINLRLKLPVYIYQWLFIKISLANRVCTVLKKVFVLTCFR